MRQLSSLDTQFLNVESPTTGGHVGCVLVVEPVAGWGVDDVRALLTSRLHLAPVLRQRLVTVPFGIARPYWVDDPSFDLDRHVHEVALPSPGTDEQLGDLIAELHEQQLDRTRPPWELYVVTGLAGGRTALYAKIHHAAVDGVAGTGLLTAMLDIRAEPRTVDPPAAPFDPRRLPSPLDLIGRGAASVVADRVRAARAVPALRHLATARGPLRAPATPLNAPIGAHRRFAFGSVSLRDIKTLRGEYGGTVNDIVLALCASVVRAWLDEHDALPDVPLVAAVPVSVRRRDRKGAPGNELSVMLTGLPTDVADPGSRVHATREAVAAAKDRFDAVPTTLLRDLSTLLPASGPAARPLFGLAGRVGPAFNLFVSNVPGPRVPLWLAGAPVRSVYPVSAVTSFTGALNITVFTHRDVVDFGFIACRDRVPDVWSLARALDRAVEELLDLCTTTDRA